MFQHAQAALRRGDLRTAEGEAAQGYKQFLASNPEWANKFQILRAEAMLLRGVYPEALSLVNSLPPLSNGSSVVQALVIKGVAQARLHEFVEAQQTLSLADDRCRTASEFNCGEVSRAWGVLALQQGRPDQARHYFQQTVIFARRHGDQFLEATALLNLGLGALSERRFDEALDWTQTAHQTALALGAGTIANKALGNLGWAYYNLGDSETSLSLSLEAEKQAEQAGDVIDQLSWLNNAGYVYQQLRDLRRAREFYLKSLDLARKTEGRADIYNALRALALVSVQSGDPVQARAYSDEALSIAHADNNRLDELYPLLVNGLIAAQLHDVGEAERIFREIEQDRACNALLRWRSQHALARTYEDANQPKDADREYRAALATFEAARATLTRSESKLPFSNNAAAIYDDYIHFLISRGRTEDALRWADFSRARTLAEGLGILSLKNATEPPPLQPQQIARAVRGTVLFYWLGEKQSYLWTVSAQGTHLATLPPGQEIDLVARRYWKTLSGPQSGSPLADPDGQWLYRILITPTQKSLPKDGRVFVIPDGSLNSLNFETLISQEPTPHYWIEDATLASGSSLRVLAAGYQADSKRRNLLLIGNSIAPNEKYPELPRAAAQVESVASHFPAPERLVITREQATPTAYLTAKPDQFSYVHFVAHGTASRTSPLDSAIILSKAGSETESFKLYARDIVQRPLRAELVTISACYGAGTRAYSGEGLVGLSWAFLRAGAHNVIGALWEASDSPTEQLMSTLYDELQKGSSPDTALRSAKLSLLHKTAYGNPFYWAPFQLYTQGRSGRPH